MHPRHRLSPRAVCAFVCLQISLAPAIAAATGSWSPPPPSLPPPPPGATCVVLQRGGPGNVHDADVSFGNGNWAAGSYSALWTGPSPYDHWLLAKPDLSQIPQGSQIVMAAFSVTVAWNDTSSQVRAHRILAPWDEPAVTWQSFGGTSSWEPATIGTFDPMGYGYKTVDITPLFQAWVGGAVPNHGLLLEEDPVFIHGYVGSEASNMALRPRFDVCYLANGPCAGAAEGAACSDGNACTTGESCHAGQCTNGAVVACSAEDACHDAGVCDPATGQCTSPAKADGAPCEDGNACTELDFCLAGICGGSPVSCADADACTVDACDTAAGCVHAPVTCNDGDLCTTDTCNPAGGCQFAVVLCDDGNSCTTDACDPAVGCVAAPVSCSDGLACTTDTCAAGGCSHVVGCLPGAPCGPSFCDTPQAQDPQLAWICN